jgi:Tol biopolymer transport system component
MSDTRRVIESVGERAPFPSDAFERLLRRRDRKRRDQRLVAAAVGLAIFAAAIAFVLSGGPFDRGQRPALPVPTDGELRRNGEVLVARGGEVYAEDPVTGEERLVMGVYELCGRDDPECSLAERAAWSSDGDWLAAELISCLGGLICGTPTSGLWIQGADVPNRQITQTCTFDGCTQVDLWRWAPARARLALVEMDRRGGWVGVGPSRLSIVDPVDGSRLELVHEPEAVTALAWSPDGGRIAYAVAGESPHLAVVAASGGTGPVVLTDAVGKVNSIAWSPDGSMLAVDGDERLFVLEADGSGLRLLGDGTRSAIPLAPSWSPDGSRIAYRTAPATVQAEQTGQIEVDVWTTSPDGSDPVRIYRVPCCVDAMWVAAPVWSPDGERVAFTPKTVSYQGEEMDPGIWLDLTADGTGEVGTVPPAVVKAWAGGAWPLRA